MRITTRQFMCVAAALALLSPATTRADAKSAALAYYSNLQRWGYDTSKAVNAVARDNTLVHGVYRLEDRTSSDFIALISERGDVRGDSTGWSHVGKDGIEPLRDDEMAQLRAEVMRGIQWERLIKLRYGDGGGRRLLLVSAVDCPHCARMEAKLAQWEGSLNTTFYVLPSALMPYGMGGEGVKAWAQVAALWCAPDPAAAWKQFWATRAVPRRGTCTLDAAGAQRQFNHFGSVMASIGAKVRGTPGLIREDATVIGGISSYDLDTALRVYGPEALQAFHAPVKDLPALVWLRAPARH